MQSSKSNNLETYICYGAGKGRLWCGILSAEEPVHSVDVAEWQRVAMVFSG